MVYIALGILGFLLIHLFDFVSLKKTPFLKPVVWASGSVLLVYAILMVSFSPDKLLLPLWLTLLGWPLLIVSTCLLIYPLFINLPLVSTYINRGVGGRLIKSGFYALVRHPGVYGFILVMIALFLISGSNLLLIAAPVWILVDIALVVIQDRFVFIRMFPGYEEYQQQTPMLIPNKRSIAVFLSNIKQDRGNKKKGGSKK